MVTVTTKEELAAACKERVAEIEIAGDLARTVHASRKVKAASKFGLGGSLLMIIGGVAAAPLTGGASAVAGFTAAASGASTAATIAAIGGIGVVGFGGVAMLLAIHKGYDVIEFKAGPVPSLKLQRKS